VFFIERSLEGKIVVETLRDAGVTVETHMTRFRHNTPDEDWLRVAGEKKWIVLMRDKKIGQRPIQLQALFQARVRAFVLVTGELKDAENAVILVKALPRIQTIIASKAEYPPPYIAKIHRDGGVFMWRTGNRQLRLSLKSTK